MSTILPSTYNEGTVSVASGGTVVTGSGTTWVNTILPGDFFSTPEGLDIRILEVTDNTHLTLAYAWPGSDVTAGVYEIRFQADMARMQETSRQLLQKLMNGNIDAFAGLTGAANKVPVFTGPGAMSLIDTSELVSSVAYDVQVNTLADRATYDAQVADFKVLVSDNGDGRAALYSKLSNTSGDWSNAAIFTGPKGLNYRGNWSNVTTYIVDDVVSYNNASWVAIDSSTNIPPAAGAKWSVLAARGATGATGPGFTWKGDYSGAAAYVVDDVVEYQGSTWKALASTTGNAPPTLPTESNTQWTLFTMKGDGFTFKGTYSGVTAYQKNDVVAYNGSTFIALGATTSNAPPPTGTPSNAYWFALATKGTDGTGTGDVVGPGSSINNDLVAFDGTTGKLIKAASSFIGVGASDLSSDNPWPQSSLNLTTTARTGYFWSGTGISDGPLGADTPGTVLFVRRSATSLLQVFYSTDGVRSWSRTSTDNGSTWSTWSQVGTVTGPATSVAGRVPSFSDTTGKVLSDSGKLAADLVVGPASSTNGAIPAFNGTGGKTLKSQTTNEAKAWLAITATDVAYGTGTVADSLDNLAQAGGKNDAIFALEIADLKGQRLGMIGGIADAFDDETGVSAVVSTNEEYDSVNDWYSPSQSSTAVAVSSFSADTSLGTPFTFVNRATAVVNGVTISKIGLYATAAVNATLKVVKRNSAGNYDVVYSQAVSHPGGGWVDFALTTPYAVPGSGTFYLGAWEPAGTRSLTANLARAQVATTDVSGSGVTLSEDTQATFPLRYEHSASINNMSLQSSAITAASVPSTARVALQTVEPVSITMNSDVVVEVSRDGTTTWTPVTMTLSTDLNSVKVYEGVVDISAQPSGSSMRWRVRTVTNKNIRISGVVLQWS